MLSVACKSKPEMFCAFIGLNTVRTVQQICMEDSAESHISTIYLGTGVYWMLIAYLGMIWKIIVSSEKLDQNETVYFSFNPFK